MVDREVVGVVDEGGLSSSRTYVAGTEQGWRSSSMAWSSLAEHH